MSQFFRIRFAALCICMLTMIFARAGHAAAGNGDLNGDGLATVADVNLIRDYIIGKGALTSVQLAAADVNGDAKVEVSDVVMVANRFAKKIMIDLTPTTASWTLTGPTGFTTVNGIGDRLGSSAISTTKTGVYKLHCNALTGYLAPADTTATLASGGSIVFTPTYCTVSSITISPDPSGTGIDSVFPTSGTLAGIGSGTIEYTWNIKLPSGSTVTRGPFTVKMVNGIAYIPNYTGCPTDTLGNYEVFISITKPVSKKSPTLKYTVALPSISSVSLGSFSPGIVRLNGKTSVGGTISGSGSGKVQYQWRWKNATSLDWTYGSVMTATMTNGTAAIPSRDDFLTNAYGMFNADVIVGTIESNTSSYYVADVNSATFGGFLEHTTDTLQGDTIYMKDASSVNGAGNAYLQYRYITQKPDGSFYESPICYASMTNGSARIYDYPAKVPTDMPGEYHTIIRVINTSPVVESNSMTYTVLKVANVTSVTFGQFTSSIVYNGNQLVMLGSDVSTTATINGSDSGWVEYNMVISPGSTSTTLSRVYMQNGSVTVDIGDLPNTTGTRTVNFWVRHPVISTPFSASYTVVAPVVINSISVYPISPASVVQGTTVSSPTAYIQGRNVWNIDYHWIVEKPDGSTFDSGPITALFSGSYYTPKYKPFPSDQPGTYKAFLRLTDPAPVKESAKVTYTVTLPPIAETIYVKPFTPATCPRDGKLVTSGTLVGSGSGTITYRWLTLKPDGTTADSGLYYGSMVNGILATPAYAKCPTDQAGDYQVTLRVTSQTPFKDSSPTSYTVVADKIITLNDGVTTMALVRVPAGNFVMGAPVSERLYVSDESPQHTVTFANSFYMGKYEVTQRQWRAVMGSNPAVGAGIGDHYPVYCVTWNNVAGAGGFIESLNAYLASSGQGCQVRLPSESEWEYACRAGTTTRYYFGDSLSTTDDNADGVTDSIIYSGKRSDYAVAQFTGQTSAMMPVGSKRPNAWGLYDMGGNVYEFCQDWQHSDYVGAPVDGSAWISDGLSYRIARGGSWGSSIGCARSAYRWRINPSTSSYLYGIRLAGTSN